MNPNEKQLPQPGGKTMVDMLLKEKGEKRRSDGVYIPKAEHDRVVKHKRDRKKKKKAAQMSKKRNR